MDALSRLLMLNDPQGSIDQNCLLSRDWQLPHAAGELSVIRWHTVTQGFAQLDMPDGTSSTLRPGTIVILPQNSAHRLCQTGEEQTHIVCGSLRLQASSRYFLTALPEVLILAPEDNSPISHCLQPSQPLAEGHDCANAGGIHQRPAWLQHRLQPAMRYAVRVNRSRVARPVDTRKKCAEFTAAPKAGCRCLHDAGVTGFSLDCRRTGKACPYVAGQLCAAIP